MLNWFIKTHLATQGPLLTRTLKIKLYSLPKKCFRVLSLIWTRGSFLRKVTLFLCRGDRAIYVLHSAVSICQCSVWQFSNENAMFANVFKFLLRGISATRRGPPTAFLKRPLAPDGSAASSPTSEWGFSRFYWQAIIVYFGMTLDLTQLDIPPFYGKWKREGKMVRHNALIRRKYSDICPVIFIAAFP